PGTPRPPGSPGPPPAPIAGPIPALPWASPPPGTPRPPPIPDPRTPRRRAGGRGTILETRSPRNADSDGPDGCDPRHPELRGRSRGRTGSAIPNAPTATKIKGNSKTNQVAVVWPRTSTASPGSSGSYQQG